MAKLKKRPDGRYVKTVTDPRTGKRVYFYGASEREINRKILEFKETASKGRTFAEVADEWWGEAMESLVPTTARNYASKLKVAVNEFGETAIKDITARNVQNFINRISGSGTAAAMARGTVSYYLIVINQIFKHAIVAGDCDNNPASSVTIPKGLAVNKRSAADACDEVIIKKTPDVWLFPYFILYTGLRRGEALALTGADIDFEQRVIRVTRSVYFDGNVGKTKGTKTEAGVRTVPILDQLLPHLPKLADDEYLFPNKYDKRSPMTKSMFLTLLEHYHKNTGTSFTPHQLRHSYATILFECGIEAKTAQHLLGHAQINTTLDIYTDFRKAAEQNATARLNDYLSKKLSS